MQVAQAMTPASVVPSKATTYFICAWASNLGTAAREDSHVKASGSCSSIMLPLEECPGFTGHNPNYVPVRPRCCHLNDVDQRQMVAKYVSLQ